VDSSVALLCSPAARSPWRRPLHSRSLTALHVAAGR
jgi:hypothetical protein